MPVFYIIILFNYCCKVGHTALMRAAMEGHTNICKYLVDNGADVNVLAKVSSTCLLCN